MAQEKTTFEDWLDDLCVRFIINLPREDLSSVARICFQIEEAQWFYEDFIRPLEPSLPTMSLRSFSLKMFQHCPILASFSVESHLKAFAQFLQYKQRVPVRGVIMLNQAMDAAVLVKGYKKNASWSFPRGKINKDEDDLDCAVREAYEETGYDLRAAGLVAKNAPVHPLEITMHEQQLRLFVFRGVPEDTLFEAKTRKEIGAIKWYNVSDLPAYRKKKGAARNQGPAATSHDKFYMVAPFMVPLRQWVLKQQKLDARNASAFNGHLHPPPLYEENLADDDLSHEMPPQTGTATHSDLDNATRELHRLLQVQPPTQGLQPQPQSGITNQQAGDFLLGLLQPRTAINGGQHPSQSRETPHTPLHQEVVEATQPPTPHYHHPTQRIPLPNHAAPPSFATGVPMNQGFSQYNQSHRPRPHVYVTEEIPSSAAIPKAPHYLPQPPVRLLHPQPLPPQVQERGLLRNLVSSPPGTDTTGRTIPSGQSFARPQIPQANQYPQHGPASTQRDLLPHSANLLGVLKGNGMQGTTHPITSPLAPPTQTASRDLVEGHRHQRPLPNPVGFSSQYGPSSMSSSTLPTIPAGPEVNFSPTSARPVAPTDQHRAGLLGMFKKAESMTPPVHHSQEPPLSNPQPGPNGQQTKQLNPSAAETMRVAAQENGRPIEMNPETNLPFGAHSILSRPQAGRAAPQASTRPLAALSEGSRNLPIRRAYSPATSASKPSPRQDQFSSKAQETKRPSPLEPSQSPSGHAFPQGMAQGGSPNPLALFPNPPAASTLPVPGIKKARQPSTSEQRNALLSLFGRSQSGAEQGKGKESMVGGQVGAGAAPQPRVAPVAPSGSEGGASASGGPRRGNSTPLSPADRNFLLGFLENATNNA
ncbi:hypothetical protein GGR56DRAFT_627798, partial [Xylariaceae sp. FL0804]